MPPLGPAAASAASAAATARLRRLQTEARMPGTAAAIASNGARAERKRRAPDSSAAERGDGPLAGASVQRGPLPPEAAADLDARMKHASLYHTATRSVMVEEMLARYRNNARGTKMVVPTNLYQRYQRKGWDTKQQQDYVSSVFEGRAATPFVLNLDKSTARVMDGGHRLEALVGFKKGKFGLRSGGSEYYWDQLQEEHQVHFDQQYLQVQEFKSLPLREEIEQFLKLNSGLSLSLGEQLFPMNLINPIVYVAKKVTKKTNTFAPPQQEIEELCRIGGSPCTGKDTGRQNEIVMLAHLFFNVVFREPGAALATCKGETFVATVRRFSGEPVLDSNGRAHNPQLAQLPKFVSILRRTLDLYNTVSGPAGDAAKARTTTGQTDFRRLVTCEMAIAAIPEADLDAARFASFVADVNRNKRATKLHHILTSNASIDAESIKHFVASYQHYVQQAGAGASAVPPPPPHPPAPAAAPPAASGGVA